MHDKAEKLLKIKLGKLEAKKQERNELVLKTKDESIIAEKKINKSPKCIDVNFFCLNLRKITMKTKNKNDNIKLSDMMADSEKS